VIDFDTELDQQLFDVAVGRGGPQLPAHPDHDHLRIKPDPAKLVSVTTTTGTESRTSLHKPALIMESTSATDPADPHGSGQETA
jgi:hypothetical protein